jgi:hypothetical protein
LLSFAASLASIHADVAERNAIVDFDFALKSTTGNPNSNDSGYRLPVKSSFCPLVELGRSV